MKYYKKLFNQGGLFLFKNPILIIPLVFSLSATYFLVSKSITFGLTSTMLISRTDFYLIVLALVFSYFAIKTFLMLIFIHYIYLKETGKQHGPLQITKSILTNHLFSTIVFILMISVFTVLEMIARSGKNSERSNSRSRSLFRNNEPVIKSLARSAARVGARWSYFIAISYSVLDQKSVLTTFKDIKNIFTSNLKIIINQTFKSYFNIRILTVPSVIILYMGLENYENSDPTLYGPLLGSILVIMMFADVFDQVFAMQLAMWHENWKHQVKEAHERGDETPKFESIVPPSLVDNVNDLSFKNK